MLHLFDAFEILTRIEEEERLLEDKPKEDKPKKSFSISPEKIAKEIDLKTPSTKHRILSMQKIFNAGYKFGISTRAFGPNIMKRSFCRNKFLNDRNMSNKRSFNVYS